MTEHFAISSPLSLIARIIVIGKWRRIAIGSEMRACSEKVASRYYVFMRSSRIESIVIRRNALNDDKFVMNKRQGLTGRLRVLTLCIGKIHQSCLNG